MNVVELSSAVATRQQRNSDAFLNMESDIGDLVQAAKICTLLLEDMPKDHPNTETLDFAISQLVARIDKVRTEYYEVANNQGGD